MASVNRTGLCNVWQWFLRTEKEEGGVSDRWLLFRRLRGRLAFVKCSRRTRATFGGLTLARKLPPYPLPSGRADGWSCPQSLVGQPQPQEEGQHLPPPAVHTPQARGHPQSLNSRPGGSPVGGVHILAPSWSGGGEAPQLPAPWGHRTPCLPSLCPAQAHAATSASSRRRRAHNVFMQDARGLHYGHGDLL